ncbi:MAG TPA: YfiR family protein [Bryobacteraceae bacterium]|jgi:hypothetical protein
MAALHERPIRRLRVPWRQLFSGALSLLMLAQPCAAADSPLEYGVKAAFLLNFTKFIAWPPTAWSDSQAPMEICILGKDPFGSALDEVVRGESVSGHRLAVRHIAQAPAAGTCQILFIDPEVKDVPRLLGGAAHGILTVGEGERFIRDGGMIAFVIDNRRVRFDVNQGAVGNADLKISSKLLSVARTVK